MRNLAVNSAFASARQEQNQASRPLKPSGVPWLGDIPVGWDVKRGKEILAPLKRPIREDDEIVTCFRDGEVTLRRNRREDGFTVAEKEIGYQGVEKGDLIVHGMDGFAGSIGVSDSRGKASPVLIVLNSTENKHFLMYYLRSLALCDVFLSLSTGIRERSCDLRWNKLGNIPYLLPPLSEQRAIADFLDEKCAAIDAIVEEAKSGIEEYAKWKQSVVFQAVTKGLDPHAKMKDSGVEWIGEIPEKWKVEKLRFFGMLKNGISKGGDFFGEGSPFVSYSDVFKNDSLPEKVDGLVLSSPEEQDEYSVRRGDVFFTRTSETIDDIGKAAVCLHSIPHATFAGFLIRVRPQTEKMSVDFSKYYFRNVGFQSFFSRQLTLVTRASLSQNLLKNLAILLPPLPEQRAIADYLDEKCAAIDALIEEKKQLIEDLGVYKKSLIYETVTGKRRAG